MLIARSAPLALVDYVPGSAGYSFVRASPTLQVGADGRFAAVAASALRDAYYINGVRHTYVEVGTTNFIATAALRQFIGWLTFGGSSVTITQGQTIDPAGSVPGSPVGEATRIQTSGGSNVVKYYIQPGTRAATPLPEAHSVLVHNLGATTVQVATNGAGASVNVAPGETRYVQTANAAPVAGAIQLTFRALNAADNLDFLAWGPQIEQRAFCTTFTGINAAARVDEAFWFEIPLLYRMTEMTAWARFTELGMWNSSAVAVIGVGRSHGAGDARAYWYSTGAGASYRGYINNGTVGLSSATFGVPAMPAAGATVDARLVTRYDGTLDVGMSVNGAAEIVRSATSPPLAPALLERRVYFGIGGLSSTGVNASTPSIVALQRCKVIRRVRTLAELTAA